jgi:hypothetical protein
VLSFSPPVSFLFPPILGCLLGALVVIHPIVFTPALVFSFAPPLPYRPSGP